MRNQLLEPLVKAQEEIFRVTGKIIPLYAFVKDVDFELIYVEATNQLRPYRFTVCVQIAPDIFVCRERSQIVP